MLEKLNTAAVQHHKIAADYAGQRLDNYLFKLLKGVPKTYIYKIIRKGEVRVNKGRINVAYKLEALDEVRIPPIRIAERPEFAAPSSQQGKILEGAILFENDDMIILNKPSGWAVHGGSGVSLGVIEALRQLRQPKYLELVHRIDKGTSGCLMLAKNRASLLNLQEQLKQGGIKKHYLTLVQGKWPQQKKVTAPLLKTQLQSGDRWVRVDPEGKRAETHFKVLATFDRVTLLSASPITGRTHQIRVHAAFLGCPIVGDDKYGVRAFNREMSRLGVKSLCLHANSLELTLPGQDKVVTFEAPHKLPIELFSSN